MSAERTELSAEITEPRKAPPPGPLDHVGPFEVRGAIDAIGAIGENRELVSVGWEDGEVYGHGAAIVLLRMQARITKMFL